MEHLTPDLTMAQETLAQCLDEQTKAVLLLHWQEVATNQDLPLDPNYDGYYALEEAGMLRCYILRDQGIIQGYAVFMLNQSLKYQAVTEAYCDLLYVAPRLRGQMVGPRFIQWCDEQLAKAGVQFVRHCSQRTREFGPTLTRLGYEPEQTIYLKRLDKDVT